MFCEPYGDWPPDTWVVELSNFYDGNPTPYPTCAMLNGTFILPFERDYSVEAPYYSKWCYWQTSFSYSDGFVYGATIQVWLQETTVYDPPPIRLQMKLSIKYSQSPCGLTYCYQGHRFSAGEWVDVPSCVAGYESDLVGTGGQLPTCDDNGPPHAIVYPG